MIRRRGLTILVLVLAGAFLLGPFALRAIGTWLVVDEPLQHSRAIVVFGGAPPFRAMEAAALYKQGWAPELWITTGRQRADDEALARLGIDRPPEHHYNVRAVERLGVPASAIRVLAEPVANTAEEVGVVAQHLRDAGGGAVILVTSQYHTRRVRFLWRRVAAPGSEARVHYAREEPLDPQRWWRNSNDVIGWHASGSGSSTRSPVFPSSRFATRAPASWQS